MFHKASKPGAVLLLGLLLVSLTGFAPAQQATPPAAAPTARITQVDTTQFPEVTVYVSVTDANGEPVGVSPTSILLQENGKPIIPDEIGGSGEIGPLATMLVMDVSGSMNSSGKLQAAQQAALAYVDQARPQDLIGLITFNTQVEYVQPLTEDREAMVEAIQSLEAYDDTAMYDALQRAMGFLEAVQGRKAIILLTDGLDNRSKTTSQEVVQGVGSQGLSISTIGLGDPTHSKGALSALDEAGLTALAEGAGGAYGYANDAESLRRLYQRYGRALQSEYAITYTTPSTLRDGVNRSLSVTLAEAQGASSQAGEAVEYNPGGLVPEVSSPAPWGLFLILLGGLSLLLFVPLLVGRVFAYAQARRPGKAKPVKKVSRIKLKS